MHRARRKVDEELQKVLKNAVAGLRKKWRESSKNAFLAIISENNELTKKPGTKKLHK